MGGRSGNWEAWRALRAAVRRLERVVLPGGVRSGRRVTGWTPWRWGRTGAGNAGDADHCKSGQRHGRESEEGPVENSRNRVSCGVSRNLAHVLSTNRFRTSSMGDCFVSGIIIVKRTNSCNPEIITRQNENGRRGSGMEVGGWCPSVETRPRSRHGSPVLTPHRPTQPPHRLFSRLGISDPVRHQQPPSSHRRTHLHLASQTIKPRISNRPLKKRGHYRVKISSHHPAPLHLKF